MLLYYITDRHQFPGDQIEHLLEKIEECVASNVDYIQLREKDLNTRKLTDLAEQAVGLVSKGARTKLLINSRLDVVLATGAHGVHLPANGLPAKIARRVLDQAGMKNSLVAVSTHTPLEVAEAHQQGADLVVFGPVFEKDRRAHSDGLERLKEACQSSIRVLALGGVTIENARQCRDAGAAGIAGIRIFQEGNPAKVVSALQGW